ncbi:unnamed protein product, partial [Ixodes hexagonus]
MLVVKVLSFFCIFLLFLAVVFLLMSLLKTSDFRTILFTVCESPTCSRYGHLVNHSLGRSVKPCDNFYQHVCNGWTRDHLQSVLEEQYVGHVTALLRKTRSPQKNQSPLQKVAKLFQSCEDVLAMNRESVPMAEIMRGTFLDWPRSSAFPDVLRSIARLQVKLNLSILLVMERRYYKNHTAVLIWPCDGILMMKRRREEI